MDGSEERLRVKEKKMQTKVNFLYPPIVTTQEAGQQKKNTQDLTPLPEMNLSHGKFVSLERILYGRSKTNCRIFILA